MGKIIIDVGNENWGRGRTTVTLESGEGIHIEKVRKLEVRKKLSGQIWATKFNEVFDYVQKHDVLKLPNVRAKGVPDEARWMLDINGKKLEVWDGDVRSNPILCELVSLLQELVSQSTNEEVVL